MRDQLKYLYSTALRRLQLDETKRYLECFQTKNQLFQNQIAILGTCAAFFLIVKTLISAYINRRILKFLSTNTAILSSKLYKDLLNTPPMMLDGSSSQRNLYAITQGVQSLNVGAVGS